MSMRELKAQRVRVGLTQKDIAEYLSISTCSYNKKENGINPFTTKELLVLKKLLKLNAEEFLKIFFNEDVTLNH